MKIRFTSRKSFTLTEVVVSTLLLVIIWLSAVDALIVGKYSASYAKHKIQAMYAAQLAIENLRKIPYVNIQNSNTVIDIDTKATPDNHADDFTGRQIITVSADLGYYRSVLVDIQWNEILLGINRPMHEYCFTYIANEPQVN
jgi:hypothetical protein